MIWRLAVGGGALITLVATFLPYFDLRTGAGFVGDEFLAGERFHFWELAETTDVALLVLCAAAVVAAAAGARRASAMAAAGIAGATVFGFVEMLANGIPRPPVGAWLMPAGGVLAVVGGFIGAGAARATARPAARALLVAGVAVVMAAAFLPFYDAGSRTITYWQWSLGADVALLVAAVLAATLAAARLDRAAAVAGAVLGADVVLTLAEFLAAEGTEPAGAWLMAGGGPPALAGAALALDQRRTRAS